MPYEREPAQSRHGRDDLVDALAQEMTQPQGAGATDAPNVREEAQRYTDRIHVYVIWNRWAEVPETDRGAIILDAYERALSREYAMRIAIAMGVTPLEAENLGIA